MTVDRFERAGGSTWRAFAVAIIIGPAALLSSLYVVPVTLACTAIEVIGRGRTPHAVVGLVVRAFWLGIALLGLFALVDDVRAITDLAPPP
jgi:hypothetical protein